MGSIISGYGEKTGRGIVEQGLWMSKRERQGSSGFLRKHEGGEEDISREKASAVTSLQLFFMSDDWVRLKLEHFSFFYNKWVIS